MRPAQLAAIIARVAGVQRRCPDAAADLAGAVEALTLWLAEKTAPAPVPTQRRMQIDRLVELDKQLRHMSPAERREAITASTGISDSYYYELRANARDLGLFGE